MLAVLAGLLEAGHVQFEVMPSPPEPDRHLVRIGIGALDAPWARRVVDADVFDDLALFVVETAQERAGAEQAAEAAIGQGGERVC